MGAGQAKPKVFIDNERVIVTEWHFKPGDATGHHRHGHDYVVVPLTTGKLRLVARRPTPSDLARLAFATSMLPEHKHGLLLRERYYFGHDPIGTGPYRALKVERAGIELQRNEAFAHGGTAKPSGTVQNFVMHAENGAADARRRFLNGEADLLIEDSAANASASARAVNGVATPIQGYAALVLRMQY